MKTVQSKNNSAADMYKSAPDRERTIGRLFSEASCARKNIESYWQRMRAYYDGYHDTARLTGGFLASIDLPWKPAAVPDAYMHVESQIEPNIPDFEFSGREASDITHARQREAVVRYVCDINDMETKNAVNERRMNLFGSAVWKLSVGVGEDGTAEISIDNPSLENIYPDPYASNIDECEYIAYSYKISATKASRLFAADLEREKTSIEEILLETGKGKSSPETDVESGLCDVTEWWFRQPTGGTCKVISPDGKSYVYTYRPGDIALSILICGREIRYIPKFWENSGCNRFPFVIYSKIPSDGAIWGRSEIEQIIPLIDAADRQLVFAQLNTAFSASDILLCEENAFAPDSYPDNRPGAIWKLRPGMIDKVSRLGGISGDSANHYEIVDKYRALMKETLGNYDFMQGDSATKVTTATGLALLADFANKRVNAKSTCKKAGFSRLYRLIDYLALEVYGKEKLALIGVDVCDAADGVDYVNTYGYVPQLDVSVFIGDGYEYSRSYALSALKSLAETSVTKENYPVVREYIRAIQIPECAGIISELDKIYESETVTNE